jgi:HSP20 family protein
MEENMANQEKKGGSELKIWQPNGEFEQLGRYFEDVFGRSFFPTLGRFPAADAVWAPSIDVMEEDDKFLVKAELPGVKEEDINVSISGNTLTIEGEKRSESESKKNGYHYSETSYGSFSRSLSIPSTVDVDKIDADCQDGVLKITLPKMMEVKPKKIALTSKKPAAAEKKEDKNAKK